MKGYIFLYDEVALFEVILVSYFMKTQGEVIIVSEQEGKVYTQEGITVISDCELRKMETSDVDVFIIPGGNICNIKNKKALYDVILQLDGQKKVIAGICAGREIIKDALNIKIEEDLTEIIEKRIVMSPGNEYVDFAITVGKVANIFKDKDDLNETIEYFRNFKAL